MARENQGLHAALIVFVVLTIFLAVSTFVFFSQAKDAKEQAAKYGKDAQTNQALATDKDKLMKEFMGMMGFAEGDSPETVRDKFAEDMQKFAPKDVDEQARVYREVLRRQDELIKLGNQSYAVEQAKTKKYEEDLVAVNQLADAKIAEFEKQAAEATKDKDRETLQFQQDRDRIEKAQEQLAGDLDQTRKDHQQELGLKDTDIAKLKQDVVALADVYAKAKGMVDDMRQEVPDQFQAQVRLVNQRGGIVWLDRGSDDGLRPQTKFSVFPSGSSNVSEVGKKANIEVTRVLNGHLAEARIVDDDPLNPIMVGDKLYSPVWNAGERRHFAVVGEIDLDNNGRDDLERLHTLIEMNGGVIDARMNAQGARAGQMSMNTRYLVLGEEYDPTATAEMREDYNRIRTQADQLKIETIPLGEFLELMGWNQRVKIARFGGGGYDQFPVEKDASPSVSTGTVSELFKPRKAPASSRSSAY